MYGLVFSRRILFTFFLQISPIPSASSTVTSPTAVDTDYKTFDCSFSIALPAVTGAYSYDVKVFPGDVTERAANTINVGERIGKHIKNFFFFFNPLKMCMA